MSMFTRCPHCETVFRVTPQQLQVSSGQVRCGRCQQVFDAFSTLTSRLSSGSPEQAHVGPPRVAKPSRPAVPETPAARAEPARESVFVAAPEGTAFTSGGAVSVRPAVAAASTPEAEVLTLPDELFGAPARPARRWPWVLACLLALLVLGAQAAWFFPGELALRAPGLRPLLVQYCAWTQCRVELPRVPDLLFIEASDLQLLDPAQPSEVLLTATVRNRAAFEQALPLLELTLTDAANRTAARKVFAPAEYLGQSVAPQRGIGAGQEVSIRLYLDTGDLKAAGYRLYLFFA